jgi:hypothetical protein
MLRGGFYYIDCEGFNFTSNNNSYDISDAVYKDIIKNRKALFITNFKVNGKQYPATPVYSYQNSGTEVINNANSFNCRFHVLSGNENKSARIIAISGVTTNY